MATQQLQLVCDNSTLTNFKQWAKAISDWFRTCGWTNSSDTGQVNWATIASVPGANAYVFDIFKPGDALTAFYLKVEYGNITGSSNAPSIRISAASGTDGAGNLTGFVTNILTTNGNSFAAPSSSTQYECNMCGTSSKMAIMMWRNAPANQGQEFFAVQRSLDNSGNETGDYITLWAGGIENQTTGQTYTQQSLDFSDGPAPVLGYNINNGWGMAWCVRAPTNATNSGTLGSTQNFKGKIPIDFCAPSVGSYDNPGTVCGVAHGVDMAEGVPFPVTNRYGQSKTYMPSMIGPFKFAGANYNRGDLALLMEYD